MIRKILLAACAAIALAAPAHAQFVYYPGWFKTMPNGSTLTDTSAGVFSFSGNGQTFTITATSGGPSFPALSVSALNATFNLSRTSTGGGAYAVTYYQNNGAGIWTTGLRQNDTSDYIINQEGGAGNVLVNCTANCGTLPGQVVVGASNSCSKAGLLAWVSDASVAYGASTRGGQITGSGANGVPAFCDGTHWDFL